MPFLSVIIPVYNSCVYLYSCLDSILTQSFQDFEVILIDDGSIDGSLEICLEYALLDSRIRVFHQKNSGPSAARNAGIDNAKGDYISFVDSDDELTKETFQLNMSYLLQHRDTNLLQFPMTYLYYNGKKEIKFDKEMTIEGLERINSVWCTSFEPINGFMGAKIYQRKVLDNIRLSLKMWNSEDALLMCKVLPHCNKVYLSNFGMYIYHIHVDSLSFSVELEQAKRYFSNRMFILLQKMQNALELKLSSSVKVSSFSFFLTSLSNFVINKSIPIEYSLDCIGYLDSYPLSMCDILLSKTTIKQKSKVILAKLLKCKWYLQIMEILHSK